MPTEYHGSLNTTSAIRGSPHPRPAAGMAPNPFPGKAAVALKYATLTWRFRELRMYCPPSQEPVASMAKR